MPLLGTRGAASARGFGFTAQLGGGYWIGILGGAGPYDYGKGIAVDSNKNVYIAGYTASQGPGADNSLIAKYNSSGVIQWQKVLGFSSKTVDGYAVAVDSSSNVYVVGGTTVDSAGGIFIAKYDTSGALQWQRTLTSIYYDDGLSVAVDSSGNVYLTGLTSTGPAGNTANIAIAKYNTSGTIQWQRTLGATSVLDSGRGISVDSTGNVYICGVSNVMGGGSFQIAKYDTNGNIQWQRNFGDGGSNGVIGYAIAVDSSGNAYVCGDSFSVNASGDIQIAKYNTSGTLQWQNRLTYAGISAGRGISVDSTGNVYVCGYSNTGGVSMDFQIAKYNTSGTIQWQRYLGGSGVDSGAAISVDSSGDVYVCGYSNASGRDKIMFAKLPSDGSKTGTYTVGGYSYTYASSSLTSSASALASSTATLTDASGTLTDAASSLTTATTTLTSSVTTI